MVEFGGPWLIEYTPSEHRAYVHFNPFRPWEPVKLALPSAGGRW